jgi:hypothetical protein
MSMVPSFADFDILRGNHLTLNGMAPGAQLYRVWV